MLIMSNIHTSVTPVDKSLTWCAGDTQCGVVTNIHTSVTTVDESLIWCAGDTQCGLPGKVDGS